MPPVGILDVAANEVAAAADHLEAARPGYGELFLQAYARKLAQIAHLPRSGAKIRDANLGQELRAFSLSRFRYVIVVALRERSPVIVALAHTSRDPGYWRDRIE